MVFTKYDRLVSTERVAMTKAGLEPTIEQAEENAKARFRKECVAPFKDLVRDSIPYISVSSMRILNLQSTPFTHLHDMYSALPIRKYPQ